MKMKRLALPVIILVVGLVLAVVAAMFAGILLDPAISQKDFDYSVTYTIDGETKTLEGVFRCTFEGHGVDDNPLERFYDGQVLGYEDSAHPGAFTIAQEGDRELCVVVFLSCYYLMGDGNADEYNDEPYLAIYDANGVEYDDVDLVESFGAEIVDWVYPEPVENSFAFAGFSGALYDGSMAAMLLVGLLTMVACIVFVKKDAAIAYTNLDKLSVLVNFLVGILALPFITLVAWLMQIFSTSEDIIYQVYLCLPALGYFAIAASVALRRRGFPKSGLFVQLVIPALFILHLIVEYVVTNWFG